MASRQRPGVRDETEHPVLLRCLYEPRFRRQAFAFVAVFGRRHATISKPAKAREATPQDRFIGLRVLSGS
eukprot:13315570-Alexandrium_andersonii.AAC.1